MKKFLFLKTSFVHLCFDQERSILNSCFAHELYVLGSRKFKPSVLSTSSVLDLTIFFSECTSFRYDSFGLVWSRLSAASCINQFALHKQGAEGRGWRKWSGSPSETLQLQQFSDFTLCIYAPLSAAAPLLFSGCAPCFCCCYSSSAASGH